MASLFVTAGPVQAVGLSALPVPAQTALAAPAAVLAPAVPAPPAAIPVQAIPVQPGAPYVISDKELCTTGFAVTSATGQPGFATAGHCGAPGDPVQTPHGEPLGAFAASAFPGTD